MQKACVCMWREDEYTLQSSIILSGTLYSNIKFILDRKYFQKIIIIKKNENHFSFNADIHIWLIPSLLPWPQLSVFGWPPSSLRADIPYGRPFRPIKLETNGFTLPYKILKNGQTYFTRLPTNYSIEIPWLFPDTDCFSLTKTIIFYISLSVYIHSHTNTYTHTHIYIYTYVNKYKHITYIYR